ncbi:MAG: M23 family metallopeptidase [Clostridia bacterium]|nr:M23 family metallopeptidase [Clostridia bacterium]
MKVKVNSQKIKAFFKKNMYYMIMGVCVLAIGAMITVAVVVSENEAKVDETPNEVINPGDNVQQQPDTDTPVITPPDTDIPDTDVVVKPEPIVFGMPVENGTVIKDYVMDTLVWCNTLKQYQVHGGIDYTAEENASVLCVYDGVVKSVSYDALNGHVVTVDHGNGLVTSYSSLSEPIVAEGQTVYKGSKLSTISTSATKEMSDGAHVHFSVTLNGQTVSPYDYMLTSDK